MGAMRIVRVSKNIERVGNKFYLYGSKAMYLGCYGYFGDEKVFITHIKIPSRHFYIKGRGYPINEELLKVLKRAGIRYIFIPEETKREGFRVWIGKVEDYLNGERIVEPKAEPQMSIPLDWLTLTNLTKEKIERMMGWKR